MPNRQFLLVFKNNQNKLQHKLGTYHPETLANRMIENLY